MMTNTKNLTAATVQTTYGWHTRVYCNKFFVVANGLFASRPTDAQVAVLVASVKG